MTPEELWQKALAAVQLAIAETPTSAMGDRSWNVAGVMERYLIEIVEDVATTPKERKNAVKT